MIGDAGFRTSIDVYRRDHHNLDAGRCPHYGDEGMAEPAQRRYTLQEFDEFEAAAGEDVHYELFDGWLVAMSNPTVTHEQIAGNIGAPLKIAMNKRGCRSYQGGIAVRPPDGSSSKFRPDVVVHCGKSNPADTVLTDPIVVVEVLSPGTIDHDRTGKLAVYKAFPSLRDIVLAYSDSMRVEHYRRASAAEEWSQVEALVNPDDKLVISSVDFEIELDEVYFDLPF